MLKPAFVADNRRIPHWRPATRVLAVVGFVDADRDLYNAAALCAGGEVIATYHKRSAELRGVRRGPLLHAGPRRRPARAVEIGGVKVCVSICEDIWSPFGPLAEQPPAAPSCASTSTVAVPRDKLATTRADAGDQRRRRIRAIVYVNRVGGQDELIYDGGSMVFDAEGTLLARSPQFLEHLLVVDVPIPPIYRKRLLDPAGVVPRSSCRWCT